MSTLYPYSACANSILYPFKGTISVSLHPLYGKMWAPSMIFSIVKCKIQVMSYLFHKLELKLELTVANLLFHYTNLYPSTNICDRREEERERMWSLTKGREGDSFSCIQMMPNPTLSTLLSSHLLLTPTPHPSFSCLSMLLH